MSLDYRHVSIGSLNMPPSSAIHGAMPLKHSTASPNAVMARFDGPRSPPGRQSTSHVPCKFFRAGACQAGNSCPFSHDPASTTDNICKYFAKGNCRFGPKCANIHVLPDGRRINYTKSMNNNTSHLNVNGQIKMEHFHSPKSTAALTNSYLRSNGGPVIFGHQSIGNYREENFPVRQHGYVDLLIPLIDEETYTPALANHIVDEDLSYGYGTSRYRKVSNMVDGPLPASVESNGISWMTRHNSMASVPCKLSLDNYVDSLSSSEIRSSEALKSLHHSVFGDEIRERYSVRAASQSASVSEEYFGVRNMPFPRSTKMISPPLSVPPAVDKDWEANFTFEEDYLPETLRDLMTPQEKARRGSRNADDEVKLLSSNCTPNNNDPSSKFGSPSNASPSRWGSLFQRQQQKEEEDRARNSAFSHVGSPLRKSSLHLGESPKSAGPIARPGPTSESSSAMFLSSPPRRSSTSIISQQLQRTHISQPDPNSCELHLSSSNTLSNALIGTKPITLGDRQISNTCASNCAHTRHTPPIDEDKSESLFRKEGNIREKRRSTGNVYFGTIGGTSNGMTVG